MKGRFLYECVYIYVYTHTSCRFQCLQLVPNVINCKLSRYTVFLENSYWIISLDLVLLALHHISNFFILLDFAFPTPYLSVPFGHWVFAVD